MSKYVTLNGSHLEILCLYWSYSRYTFHILGLYIGIRFSTLQVQKNWSELIAYLRKGEDEHCIMEFVVFMMQKDLYRLNMWMKVWWVNRMVSVNVSPSVNNSQFCQMMSGVRTTARIFRDHFWTCETSAFPPQLHCLLVFWAGAKIFPHRACGLYVPCLMAQCNKLDDFQAHKIFVRFVGCHRPTHIPVWTRF